MRINVKILFLSAFISFIALNASAFTLSFYNITNNDFDNAQAGEDNLFVEVLNPYDLGLGSEEQVLFRFKNESTRAPYSITDIYFDDSDDAILSDFASIFNTPGYVEFAENASPHNLPGGSSFNFFADFSMDSDAPIIAKGINSNESLDVLFNLKTDITLADLMNEVSEKEFIIGIHVQSFANGGSESFITNGNDDSIDTETPEPGTILLMFMGVLGLLFLRKRI